MEKTIKCSSAVFVIIIFLTLGVVVGYAIRGENKTNGYLLKNKANEYERENNIIEVKQINNDDVAGSYVYNDSTNKSHVTLYLYTDGSYYYNQSSKIARGEGGYYTVKDNEVHLNSVFTHGSDIGRTIIFNEKKLSIDASGNLTDSAPTFLKSGNVDAIILEKNEVYDDHNNIESEFKKIFSFGEFDVAGSEN